MANRAARPRVAALAGWWAALVVVPLLLAAVSFWWPGPGIADDLVQRSEAALAATGLDGVIVTVSGRDVELDGVPRGAETGAVATVAALAGVRDVQVGAVTDGAPAAVAAAPTAAVPSATSADTAAGRRDRLASGIAAVVAAAPVTFDADSAELAGPAAATVQQVAALVRAEPGIPIALVGYCADAPGPPVKSQELSERRAAVVADALVAGGVDRARLAPSGRGDADPLATQAASRRVEISVG